MNDEKPDRRETDGRPFDRGVGPTTQATYGTPIEQSPARGTLGQPPGGGGDHLYLSAHQMATDDAPSWKAPRERRGVSTGAIIAIIVVLVIVLLVALKVAGVF